MAVLGLFFYKLKIRFRKLSLYICITFSAECTVRIFSKSWISSRKLLENFTKNIPKFSKMKTFRNFRNHPLPHQ